MLIYTDNFKGADKEKHVYRNPRFWNGRIEASFATGGVKIVGDYPDIKQAYEDAGVKVTVSKPAAE
jgi:hypothetical protein